MNRIQELMAKADPLLTGYAQGYGNTSYAGVELLPIVGVPKERIRIPEFGKENLRIHETERALRSNSNVLEPEGVKVIEIALREHDLAFPIDYREGEAAKGLMQSLEQYAAQNVADALLLKQEALIAAEVQNPALYAASNKMTLSGTSKWSNYDKNANGTYQSDPIKDIFAGRDASRASCGRYPNTLLLGASTYNALVNHPLVMDRIQYSQLGIATPQILQGILNVPKIVIGQSVSVHPTTNAFVDLWGDVAILAHVATGVRSQRSPFVPSFGYTFQLDLFPVVDVFENLGGKVKYVRSTNLMLPKMLAPSCGFLFTDCV